MMWIGLVVGVVIGALIGELPGAVTLGFLGWLTGLIIGSLKKAKGDALSAGAPVGSTPMPPAHTLEARVMRLEAAIARVEARLSQLDAGTLKPGSVPGLSPILAGFPRFPGVVRMPRMPAIACWNASSPSG